jgi:Uma2 family endonuclease
MTKSISAPTPPDQGVGMAYEQFLAWADEDTLAEWVDGEVEMNSPANLRHEEIAAFLIDLLKTYAGVHSLGKVLSSRFQMKLATSGREPDGLFVATQHLGQVKATYLDGPADLVVEIVSPESAGRDRGDKFYEYRAAGIPEYWLIDPQLNQAEFYQLDAQSRYQVVPPDAQGVYHSRMLPGFWLRVDWLWQDPLPDAVQTLLQIDRAAYAAYLREQLRRAGEEEQ